MRERQTISTSPTRAGSDTLPLVAVLESAPDAVVGIDVAGVIVFANRQVYTLFGYTATELIGRPVETLLPERFRDVHRAHRAHYLDDPVARPMGAGLQLAARRRDGSEFPVDISLSTIQTPRGLIATAFVRDVSDRKRAEAMFRGLLDAAPDAIVVIDEGGSIALVNRQVHALFGYAGEELIGQPVEVLVPQQFREQHPADRAAYFDDPRNRAMGAGLELTARRKDGSEFPVDIALAPFDTGNGRLVSAAIRDVTERKRAEHDAQRLREGQIRRRQALEINDSVVQGVATAVYALGRNDPGYALNALSATLESARMIMDRLLEHAGEADDIPATLVREHPATVLADADTAPAVIATGADGGRIRVVIADDTPDMRLVLRLALTEEQGFQVVGEAADGQAAVDLATECQPDVVVVDLAMPVMDGLQAIPLIRQASPRSRVVVLSGYGAEDMLDAALRAGADAYVTKGRPSDSLCTLLRDLCPEKQVRQPPPTPLEEPGDDFDEDQVAAQDLALAVTAHELATPLTVLQGMLHTLRDRMDSLPSGVVQELLEAMARHVDHVSELLSELNDARNISGDSLRLAREPLELTEQVHESIRDLQPLLHGRQVQVDAADPITVFADGVRLRQVISNVLTNAAKFSLAASPIDVRIIQLRATVQVSITDRGSGIATERRPQLFTKFARLGATTSGMGLGLYISRGIVRAHGGELRLAHTSPEGSTFVFELPITSGASAADAR